MRRTSRLLLLGAVLGGTGCTWLDKFRGKGEVAQAQGGDVRQATAEQLVNRLNQNAAAVSVVKYDDVSITMSGPDVPIGAGSLANSSLLAARPRMFRLSAGKNLADNLVQVGSNDREIWMYGDVPGQDKVLLVCAHEDFPKAAHKLPVPIDPDWALLALGLKGADPNPALYRAETDIKRRQYTLTRDVTTPGDRRVEQTTVFAADEPRGTEPLVRQHVIAEPGGKKVIARADIVSVYRVPNSDGAEVPTELTLELPERQFKMRLRLRTPKVNEALDPAVVQQLFGRPDVPGVTPINLADAQFKPTARGAAPAERRGIFGWRRD